MSGGHPELVILGWGNPSRGDDALGPLLCERLERWLPTSPVANRVEVQQDFQLQVEHVVDLVDRRLALFIDAAVDVPLAERFRFTPLTASRQPPSGSHALAPEAVLAVYARVQGEAPPPAWQLAVAGQSFDLGEGLSPSAAANLEVAWAFLQRLCLRPDADYWRSAAFGS